MIESLPRLIPDQGRSAKVRALCHHQLARQRRRIERSTRPSIIERTLVAGFAAIYLVAVAANALSVFRMF